MHEVSGLQVVLSDPARLQQGDETMKTVLLHVNRDAGQDSRLAAAIDLARDHKGLLICLQPTSWNSYVFIGDPYGASQISPEALQLIRDAENEDRNMIENRLAQAGIDWEWRRVEGSAGQALAAHATLADMVVISQPEHKDAVLARAAPFAASIVVHIQTPSLVVPLDAKRFAPRGPAIIAWNGSAEAGHAVRLSRSLLRDAAEVHIVTVSEDKEGSSPEELLQYLARHGIEAQIRRQPAGDASIAQALLAAANDLGAAYIVLGAYGHSRIRETILGGVTRDMILQSPIPMILAH
jgi:nucleotide-binding universal stress UspA family protein